MCKFLDDIDLNELDEYQKRKYDWLLNTGKSYNTIKAYWTQLNTKVHDIEVAKGKDLYQFTDEEIKNLIKNYSTLYILSKWNFYTIVNMYIQWTVDIGLNYVGNPCDRINTSELIVINETALEETYQELDVFYNNILELECSDIDKMLMVLLRYNVKLNKVADVKWDDIDKENMCVNTLSKKGELLQLPIDNMFLMFADKAKNCNEYIPIESEYNHSYEYVDEGFVVKRTTREDSVNAYFRLQAISKRNKIKPISCKKLNDNRLYDLIGSAIDNKTRTVSLKDFKKCVDIMNGKLSPGRYTIIKKTVEHIFNIKVV